MQVHVGMCPDCEVIIWSRCERDMHSCECGGLTVTNGPNNPKFVGEYANNKHAEFAAVDVDDVSPEDLFNDWKTGGKEYGWLYIVDDEQEDDYAQVDTVPSFL